MSLNQAEVFPAETGLGFRLNPGEFFKRLRFINPSETPLKLEFITSSAFVIDGRTNIVPDRYPVALITNAPTLILPLGEVFAPPPVIDSEPDDVEVDDGEDAGFDVIAH